MLLDNEDQQLLRGLFPCVSTCTFAGATHAQILVTDGMLVGTVNQATPTITQALSQEFSDQTQSLTQKLGDLRAGLTNAISGPAEATSTASACADSGFPSSASTGYPNADVRASTLFDWPQNR